MSICESKIKTDHLILQEPCKSEFSHIVYRQCLVTPELREHKIPTELPIAVIVTTKYRISIEPIGFALGRHLCSVPLAPGEEVEIEVFRSSKVERELSQQYSTEVEFTEEYSNSFRNEWSRETTSNYKEGGGVSGGVNILGIIEFGGQAEAEYSGSEVDFQRVISESVYKTKERVDRKFDLHMGLKTEVENRYRSTRKIKNPNLCRTLTYNYFQLMRKFKVTVTRIGLGFDYVRVLPRIMTGHIPAVIRSYAMPRPEIKTIVPTREEKLQSTETSSPGSTSSTTISAARLMAATMATTVAPELQVSTHAVQTLLHPIIEEPHVLELGKDRLIVKIKSELQLRTIPKELENLIEEFIEKMRKKFPVPEVVSVREMCINTNSMHVEPMMGVCLACEEHAVKPAAST